MSRKPAWSDAETAQLIALLAERDLCYEDIAAIMGRSVQGITCHMQRRGIQRGFVVLKDGSKRRGEVDGHEWAMRNWKKARKGARVARVSM